MATPGGTTPTFPRKKNKKQQRQVKWDRERNDSVQKNRLPQRSAVRIIASAQEAANKQPSCFWLQHLCYFCTASASGSKWLVNRSGSSPFVLSPLKIYCSCRIPSSMYSTAAKCIMTLEFVQWRRSTLTRRVPQGYLWCFPLEGIKIFQVLSDCS